MNNIEPPLQSVRLRWILLPIAFMAFIGIMAALLNSQYRYTVGLRVVTKLARYEEFHIAAHIVIFGLLVLMVWQIMGTERYVPIALSVVLLGTLIIEVIQFITRHRSVTWAFLGGSLFDLGINLLGAACAMFVIRGFKRDTST